MAPVRKDGVRHRPTSKKIEALPPERTRNSGSKAWVLFLAATSLLLLLLLCFYWTTLQRAGGSEDLGTASAVSKKGEVTPFCCFQPEDISMLRIGSAPGKPVFIVENFLCEDVLTRIVRDASKAEWVEAWHRHAFPGHALPIRTWLAQEQISEGPIAQLAAGQHLACLQDALNQLRDQGRLSDIDENIFFSMNRSDEPVNTLVDSVAPGIDPAQLTESRLKALTRKAKSVGLLENNVSEWALLSLLNNHTVHRHVAGDGADSLRLTYVSTRPVSSDIHLDNAQLVINIPLTDGHEDTGTSFWRARPLPNGAVSEYCGVALKELRHCVIARSRYYRKTEQLRQSPSNGQGMSFAHGTDDTGEFEQFHMLPWRKNRAAVYSGHLFHSSFIPPQAERRILANRNRGPTHQRLLLQDFLRPPVLAAAFLKRRLAEQDQDGMRRAAAR